MSDVVFDGIDFEEFNNGEQPVAIPPRPQKGSASVAMPPRPQSPFVPKGQIRVSQVRKQALPPRPTKSIKQVVKPLPAVDFNSVYEGINVPTIQEFVKSNMITTITWLLKNCKREKLGTIMKGKNERVDITNITPDVFKTMVKTLYSEFAYVYKVRAFGNLVSQSYPDFKLVKDGMRLRRGNLTVFDIDEEETFKQHMKSFKSSAIELFKNVDISKISLDKILEFVKLPINTTSNAYSTGKHDIDKFEYSYDNNDVSQSDFAIDEAHKISMYHELFTKTNMNKPAAVFARRACFVELLTDDVIENNIAQCLHELDTVDINSVLNGVKTTVVEEDVRLVVDIMRYLLTTDTFKNIMFRGWKPNPLVNEVFTNLFKSKAFGLVFENCLWPISYLFSSYCFWNDDLDKFIATKVGQSLANRRKLMVNYLLTTDDVALLANNSWWVNIAIIPDCLHGKENQWLTTNKDIEKANKRLMAAQNKRTKQSTKNDAADVEQPDEQDFEEYGEVEI